MASEAEGVDPATVSSDDLDWNQKDPALAWILAEYKLALGRTFKGMETFEFSEYSKSVYEFVWLRFCDWFIELIKPRIQGEAAKSPESKATVVVALQILEGSLRLLHPLMPYVTEEIWQRLGSGKRDGQSVGLQLIQPPPQGAQDEAALAEMDVIVSIIRGVRRIRGELNIHPGEEIKVVVDAPASRLSRFVTVLEALAKVKVSHDGVKPPRSASLMAQDMKYHVVFGDAVDVEGERVKLQKRLEKVIGNIRSVEGKLSSEQFTKGAPENIVEGARAQLAQNRIDKVLIEETIAALS
jgi:valyl-tRNA synthetase